VFPSWEQTTPSTVVCQRHDLPTQRAVTRALLAVKGRRALTWESLRDGLFARVPGRLGASGLSAGRCRPYRRRSGGPAARRPARGVITAAKVRIEVARDHRAERRRFNGCSTGLVATKSLIGRRSEEEIAAKLIAAGSVKYVRRPHFGIRRAIARSSVRHEVLLYLALPSLPHHRRSTLAFFRCAYSCFIPGRRRAAGKIESSAAMATAGVPLDVEREPESWPRRRTTG
jgi:hypothetical protein